MLLHYRYYSSGRSKCDSYANLKTYQKFFAEVSYWNVSLAAAIAERLLLSCMVQHYRQVFIWVNVLAWHGEAKYLPVYHILKSPAKAFDRSSVRTNLFSATGRESKQLIFFGLWGTLPNKYRKYYYARTGKYLTPQPPTGWALCFSCTTLPAPTKILARLTAKRPKSGLITWKNVFTTNTAITR